MLRKTISSKSLRFFNRRLFGTSFPRCNSQAVPENQSNKDTTENENTETKKKPSLAQESLDTLFPPESYDDDGGRDHSKGPKYTSSTDMRRERNARYFSWGVLGLMAGGVAYYGRRYSEKEAKLAERYPAPGLSILDWWTRVKARTVNFFDYYQEPAFDKLLPDPLPEPYNRPYTLVLDLEDLLVHSEWTRKNGWRTAKRPGLDYFLGYLSQYYEIVIFTKQYTNTARPVIENLDPYHISVSAALGREHARYDHGKIVKDLSFMNRDLSKIILVDTDPAAWSAQPDNAIAMAPWTGDANDRELVGLIPLLEFIAIMDIKDVRPVLKSYQGKNIPLEYARREKSLRDHLRRDWEAKRSQKTSFFGKPVSNEPPKLLIDIQRERQQAAYAEFKKYIDENGPKLLAEEKARQAEAKTTLADVLTGKVEQPQEAAPATATTTVANDSK
ncbi:TIM23 translocase complex subunit Tim50 [Schizosaccharomyces japonicus yFS275]|uniref:Mitochondrial import inner membrane translocase subunit TIM50 n=1 Tax=Schizosaccharomyces japonicus (strain yFS275 / FY16936) TaxID=402676 RepID=B6K4J8_SCHJY|nr:TIM23 translocase complex subunit Tim50 [Schizosaccharomyces japonicus yFS275]EEB08405.1 TIM23 translocase complex subunit Tim50 [Schizosaccharomyces japonicus yFS275]